MQAFMRDVAYAIRLILKQPGVTIVAVVTLALGIGANTAIFSALDTVLLRPLPYPEPDRLVMVWEKRAAEGVFDNNVSPADFLDWTRMSRAFTRLAAYTSVPRDLTGHGAPLRVAASAASPSFFSVLGVSPLLGRAFRDEEGTSGRDRVVVLGHALWRRAFGGDPKVIGRVMVLDRVPHEIVGVLPESFEFPDRLAEIFVPLALEGGKEPAPRALHYLSVYGRLGPGVSLNQARDDMNRVGKELERRFPTENRGHGAHVVDLRGQLAQPVRLVLLLLMGAVGFVLLIACVNVANLLLAKAVSRRQEMAVRAALGAGRARLLSQTLTESLLLGLMGGVASLTVASIGMRLLPALVPEDLPLVGIDRLTLDGRVLAFGFALSLLTGLVFGMLPAWQLARTDANVWLKDGGRSPVGIRRRLRVSLVVSEIALASLLLVGAGLSLRSLQALLHSDSGIRPEHVLSAYLTFPSSAYSDDEKIIKAVGALEQRLAAIAGVRAVGATSHLPLSGRDSRLGVTIEGRESTDEPTRAHPRVITPGYFQVMGIPIVSGRRFSRQDGENAPLVAIVNQTMAKRYWPDASPVGRRVRIGRTPAMREIVGVVRDIKHWGLDSRVNPEIYVPAPQFPWEDMSFVLATDGDPRALASAVGPVVQSFDRDLPVSDVRTMEEVTRHSVASRRAALTLTAAFGLLALVLAAAGIYGVMAHLVALRTSEIGLRMTLGAPPRRVMALVLREALLQSALGLGLGLSASVLLMRLLQSMLYEVTPGDPLTMASVAAVLLTTAILATLVPAVRAMRVNPADALRQG